MTQTEFASIRIITDDVERLARFYELVSGTPVLRHTPLFAELRTPAATVAIGAAATVAPLGLGLDLRNTSVIVELRVADVDADFARLEPDLDDIVLPPTTMPWGNRSLLCRDPDGNLVNLFTTVDPAAFDDFARKSN